MQCTGIATALGEGQGGQSAKNLPKIRKKREKIRKKWEKEENREGSFTMAPMTDRAGYAIIVRNTAGVFFFSPDGIVALGLPVDVHSFFTLTWSMQLSLIF